MPDDAFALFRRRARELSAAVAAARAAEEYARAQHHERRVALRQAEADLAAYLAAEVEPPPLFEGKEGGP
jgi:hypothetical protein